MDDTSILKKIADLTWSLDLDTSRAAIEVVQKIVEAKEAVEGSTEKLGQRLDQRTSDELRDLRRFLDNPDLELSGPETVLLGSLFKHLENIELLDTRSLNVTLDSYGRKPSNTTSTVENLEKKDLLEFVAGDTPHAHKTFRLTTTGYHETRDLLSRLKRKNLSAVG